MAGLSYIWHLHNTFVVLYRNILESTSGDIQRRVISHVLRQFLGMSHSGYCATEGLLVGSLPKIDEGGELLPVICVRAEGQKLLHVRAVRYHWFLSR